MPLALLTKASSLGGKIGGDHGLYNNYTITQKREFMEARAKQQAIEDKKPRGGVRPTSEDSFGKACPVCQGKKVESEHAKTLESAGVPKKEIPEAEEKIAEDHLKEDPNYYGKLKVMEAKKAMTAGSSSMAGSNLMHTAFDSAPEPNIK